MSKQTAISADPGLYLAEAERRIINLTAGTEFVAGDIQKAMANANWLPLEEPRAYGYLMVRLSREGWIRKTGTAVTSARSHHGVASTWRRTTKATEKAA